MKSLKKRIIASLLCVAVTAVNVNVCGVTAVDGGNIAATGSGRGITPSVAATPKSASTTTGSAIFEERSPSTLGDSSDDVAIKKADPYGTADNNGEGEKWATLAVVPEVCTMYDYEGHIVDYKDGDLSCDSKTLNKGAYMQVSAGLNLGSGKNDAIARLSYDVSTIDNKKEGTLYLEVCDPINGGWKTDGSFHIRYSGFYNNSVITPNEFERYSLTDVITGSAGLLHMSQYTDKFKISCFDSLVEVNQNVRGQYLSVATGDFDGDGIDSIIAYIPDFSNPKIQEYECRKESMTAFNTTINRVHWNFNSDEYYYQPTQIRDVSSNVYRDFSLTKTADTSSYYDKTRNVPIVDVVAADVDRDGRDELIVTAGLGHTSKSNGCDTVMKIYDFVEGKFSETYSVNLKSDNYNNQKGRLRWASSAVGNVQTGAANALGTDFPEIVTAGWVDINTGSGIDMKHRLGVHITELVNLTEQEDGSYVGDYNQRMVLGTSDQNLNSSNPDGVSVYMKNGFPRDWTRHDKLAVGTLAYKGLESQSAIMLGDTVYDITSEGKLSGAYWGGEDLKKVSDHTRYSVRKLVTGNLKIAKDLAGESVCFLCADINNTYSAYVYYYKDGKWYTSGEGATQYCDVNPGNSDDSAVVDICAVDVDNDSLYVKLKDVIKSWEDPKPLYVLEAAPYFSEFPNSKGSTGVGYGYESGYEVSWGATISTCVESYFSQDITFVIKLGSWSAGACVDTSLKYNGSFTSTKSVEVKHTNNSDENAVVVERTPVYIYRYDVLGYNGDDKEYAPAAIVVTGDPETAMISVDEYNSLAETYNQSHDDKLTLIDDSFGLGTPGNPLTYRRSFPNGKSNELFTMNGSTPVAYYGATGSSEKTISKSSTLSNGYEVSLTHTAYAGGDMLGFGLKLSLSLGASQGTSFFHTDSLANSGSIGRQNEDGRFDFNWDMARWLNKGIPVVGYKVETKNEDIINLPPVAPNGLTVTDTANNSATLKWTNPPTTNGRITANKLKVYYKEKFSNEGYNEKTVNFLGTKGEKTWSLTGLKRNTTYQCYIVNSYESGNDIRPSIRTSDLIEFTTADNPENVDVSVNHGKGVVLRSDSGKELQSVDKGKNASIKDVLYNVNKGYHVPDNFYITSNGITATTVGGTGDIIKVSGTPTDNTTITIPDMSLIDYDINYYSQYGTIPSSAIYNYNIESGTITLPTLERDGCIFDGWLDQGNAITSIPSGSTGDKTLHAKWLELSYLGYDSATYPADGSEEFPYLIGSTSGWNSFCEFLENDKFDNFNGKHFKLVHDIIVSRVAGSEAHKFGGIFDGNGKTLTFNCDDATSDYTAPFAYVQGTEDSHVMFKNLNVITTITSNNHQYTAGLIASQNGYTDIENCTAQVVLNTAIGTHTRSNLYSAGLVGKSEGTLNIKDCTVTGTITTDGKYAGGFVGTTRSNLTIKNSVSGVTINSSISDDGTHGGFIGIAENCNKFDIEGCLFNGNLMGSSTYAWGGFVGWNATYTRSSIKNSLFAPQSIDLDNSQNENFARNGITLANCYYMTPLGGTQGKQTHTITAGENVTIAYDGTPTTYNVSNITAYDVGIYYDRTLYAGEGDNVPLLLGYTLPAETGYHFNGYDTNSGTLSESILTMPNSDVLITGGNVANTYSVHFDPNISFYYNGNEAEVEMEDQLFTYDEQAKALSTNRYNVPRAEWLNWNTEADGSGTTYADEQQIQNLTTQNNETVTFYAQWREPNRLMYDSKIFKCYVNTTYSIYWVYAGDTVHVDVIDDKAVYTNITITGEDGTNIPFDDTNYTFTMPDQGIFINAVGKTKMQRTNIYLDEYDSWEDVAYFYDENATQVTPTVTVKNYDTDAVLEENVDYTVSIEENIGNPNRVVTATVTIMGIGDYIGTNTKQFRITPFDIADCQIDGIFEVYDDGYGPYNVIGESLKVWDGDTLLEACHDHEDGSGYYGDYDLDIELPENDDIYSYVAEHPYQAFIKGRGKWGGTKTFTFTVKELYHTIVFDANGGTGHMENDAALRGKFYHYPECTFTAPEELKKFDSWEISNYDCSYIYEGNITPSGFIAPYAYVEYELGTITLKAKWRDKYQYTITLPDSLEFASDNVTAEGVAYEDEIVALRVKEGYTVNGVQAYLENLTEEDGVYKFRVTDNTVITTYTPIVINYVDVNGFTTPTTVYKEIYTDNDYKLPSTPYLDGYTFTGWMVNATAYNVSEGKTANDVKAAVDELVEAVTDVTIAIVYTKKDGTHTVSLLSAIGCTLKNADGEEITDRQCRVSEQLYAVADQAAPEQKFSHWERTSANGSLVIAGYEKTYAFRMPDEDVTLSAVYVDSDEEVNKVGTGYIESIKRTAENKLSFIAILCVPDDCQMMKAGVVVESTDNLYDSWNDKYEELTTENARLIKYSDTSKNHYSSYKYTWTMSTSNYEKRWTVRPYLEYTDKNSNTQTIYGEAVSKCVNDVDYNNT